MKCKGSTFFEGFELFHSDLIIFLQALVNKTALRSELESMKVAFENEIDTKASQTAIQRPDVSNYLAQHFPYTFIKNVF